jgi:hypothetical protein
MGGNQVVNAEIIRYQMEIGMRSAMMKPATTSKIIAA